MPKMQVKIWFQGSMIQIAASLLQSLDRKLLAGYKHGLLENKLLLKLN